MCIRPSTTRFSNDLFSSDISTKELLIFFIYAVCSNNILFLSAYHKFAFLWNTDLEPLGTVRKKV
jgi:hypothetical protein